MAVQVYLLLGVKTIIPYDGYTKLFEGHRIKFVSKRYGICGRSLILLSQFFSHPYLKNYDTSFFTIALA